MAVIKCSYSCTLVLAMDIFGGKWKMVILWVLRHGVLRFGEIKKTLPGITQKMLTQQLRELEEAGIITRVVYPVVPPKVEYNLTVEGQKIIPILNQLCEWTIEYAKLNDIQYVYPYTTQDFISKQKD
jgi:Predicted transcriptional regulators